MYVHIMHRAYILKIRIYIRKIDCLFMTRSKLFGAERTTHNIETFFWISSYTVKYEGRKSFDYHSQVSTTRGETSEWDIIGLGTPCISSTLQKNLMCLHSFLTISLDAQRIPLLGYTQRRSKPSSQYAITLYSTWADEGSHSAVFIKILSVKGGASSLWDFPAGSICIYYLQIDELLYIYNI
jgi:hypothetical protein